MQDVTPPKCTSGFQSTAAGPRPSGSLGGRYILLAAVMYMIQISPWNSPNLHKKCVWGRREGLLLIEMGR